MLRATWRRLGSPAWLAIGVVMMLPALAEAQLFPNRTIRRERPSCASEPPFNAHVRRDYFGYYPTCWSKFPDGWACPCPNPELPNESASFTKIPFNKKRGLVDDEGLLGPDEMNPDGTGEGMPGNPPGENPNIPLPNSGRSPFDLDANPRPPATRPGPGAGGDPFTPEPTLPRPNPRDNLPATPGNAPKPPTSLMELPPVPASTPAESVGSNLQPGSLVMVPDATLASNSSDLRPDLGPLPSSPPPGSSLPAASATPVDSLPVLGQPAPAQAPRRKGLLGGLFGSGNTRRR